MTIFEMNNRCSSARTEHASVVEAALSDESLVWKLVRYKIRISHNLIGNGLNRIELLQLLRR